MIFYIMSTLMILSLSGILPYDCLHNTICGVILIIGCILRVIDFKLNINITNTIFGKSRKIQISL
jgi:chemotaxis signal transduction protein